MSGIQNNASNETPESMSAGRIVTLVAAIVAGVLVAQFFAPAVFKASPTDIARSSVLLDTLNSPEHSPEYVVLGNSITMQGVDTRIVSEQLPGKPLGYNLATTGQSLPESLFFIQELPESVELVIQVVYPRQLVTNRIMEQQKYNALYMYGFRPDERTVNDLVDVYGTQSNRILGPSHIEQTFDSRWALRQSLDAKVRSVLRPELDLEEVRTSLYFPSPRAKPLPERKLVTELRKTFGYASDQPYKEHIVPRTMMLKMIKRVQESGRQIVWVISPLNPRAEEYVSDDYFRLASEALAKVAADGNAPFINMIDWLPAELYADALHPTEDGARVLSERLGKELAVILGNSQGEIQ